MGQRRLATTSDAITRLAPVIRRRPVQEIRRREGDAEPFGDPRQTVTSPAVAKRDGDRDHARPLPPWYAIEVPNQLREEVVGVQFLDE